MSKRTGWGRLLLIVFLCFLGSGMPAHAQSTEKLFENRNLPPSRTALADLDRWLLRDLVGTVPEGKTVVGGGPRAADILGSSLIALDVKLSYGFTERLMGATRFQFYTDNPVEERNRQKGGLGDFLVEAKYRLPTWQVLRLDMAVDLKVLFPLTEDDHRSDGVIHVIPSITALRPAPLWHPLHIYTQFGIDISTDNIERSPVGDEIQESFFSVVTGLVYPIPSAMFFFDIEWQTNAAIGKGEIHNVLVTPGIRYEVPRIPRLPVLLNIDLGVHIGLADALNRYDVGLRLTLDPLSKLRVPRLRTRPPFLGR